MNKVPATEQELMDAVRAKEAELYSAFDAYIKDFLARNFVDGLVYDVMCQDGESFVIAETMEWDWNEMLDRGNDLHIDGASPLMMYINGIFDRAWVANGLSLELLQ